MRILLSILLIISPILGHAQLSTNNKVAAFNRTEGAVVYENYALNQSFDKNLVGVSTPTGGTASIVTTSGVKLFGKGSLQFAVTSTGQLTAIRSKPFPIGLNGQTCQTKFTYATPYGGAVTQREFSYFVTNSSGTKISATATLPATFDIAGTQQSKTAVVFYPCPYNSVTPANSWVELTIEHIGSASTSIIIDEKFDMVANDIGAGVPNNVFSAKVSSAGVVSDENEDFISGNCAVASGTQTCTFVSGKFNIAPNCTYSINASGVSGLASNATTSTTSLAFTSFGSSTGTPNAASFNIVCTRAGTDFIQPAITPNQWNYGPTAYTPTFGAGFGTPTNVSLFHWRTGKFLNVSGAFTSGTTSAAIGSISLPNGLTIDASALGINNTTSNPGQEVGRFNYPAVDGFGNIVTAPATSTSVVYFATNNGTGTRLTPTSSVSSNALPSTTVTSIFFRVPIAGWTENQNAPQLLGSLTSNANSALRIETAQISNNGSACAVVNQSSNWITGAAFATSQCTLTVAGDSNFPKWCLGNATQVSTGYIAVSFTTVNSTTIVSRTGYGTNDANAGYYMTCFGTR